MKKNDTVHENPKTITKRDIAVLHQSRLFKGITEAQLETLLPCLNARKQFYDKGLLGCASHRFRPGAG